MTAQPVDIVREALAEPVPCPTCGRTEPCRCIKDHATSVEVLATRIVERLSAAGMLHTEAREATQDDIEYTARWLAEQSGSPRYGGEHWTRLLESEANVVHAHGSALRTQQPAVGQVAANLNAAKTLLVAWHKRRADEN